MTDDLALRHEPIGDPLGASTDDEAIGRHALTDNQLDFYEENGYVAGMRILTDDQVDALLTELERLMDPSHPRHDLFHEFHLNESGDPDNVLFHALGAWRVEAGFHDILWNPAFTFPARQLLGGPVRFWHDQLFCKPPALGGGVAWHQDYSYWTRTKPMAHLTCWIALDDTTRENGAVAYVPGSHKWSLLPITGLAGDMDAIRGVLNDDQWDRLHHPVDIELKRGHAAFHHPLMVHGSSENRSNRPRRATVVNVFRDGVMSDADEPLLAGVPPIPKGQPMDGPFFPLLLE